LEIKLGSIRPLAGRQAATQLDASLQVSNSFDVSRAQCGVLASLQPVSYCVFGETGLCEMVRQSFGLSVRDFREFLFEHVRDSGVQMHAATL
jgi:hypothetical protein